MCVGGGGRACVCVCVCLCVKSAGFHTTIIVLIIGSLGVAHKTFISGLHILGLTKVRVGTVARYFSLSFDWLKESLGKKTVSSWG